MKKIIILFIAALPLFTMAQPTADAVLQKTYSKLNSLTQVQYRQIRHMRYFGDNYDFTLEYNIFLDFSAVNDLSLRFQAEDKKIHFIYNENRYFRIDKEKGSIQNEAITKADMASNSYLYFSLVMLKNIIPLTIANDSMQRSIADTIINGKAYHNIRIEGNNRYITGQGAIEPINFPGLRRVHYVIIDKQTSLPYRFLVKLIRNTDDRDYISVNYENIKTKPQQPLAATWTYANYSAKYTAYVPPAKAVVIKPGTMVANFKLPNYTPRGIDSISLSQYAGKVVLLDFWFKSCGYCMEAMPHYNELEKKFSKDGFALLTVNVVDPVSDMKFFYNKYKPLYKMMFNGGKIWSGLGFTACPSSVLIDRNGKVAETFLGFSPELIASKVDALVKKTD